MSQSNGLGRLFLLFILTLAISLGIFFWTPRTGGSLLDFLSSVSEVQERLQQMSAAQKNSHFLLTLLLDMPFPIVYGSFLAGLVLESFGKTKKWLLIPALLAIPVDLSENVIQLLALRGYEALLSVKAILTPTKMILVFAMAIPIALAALINLIRQRVALAQSSSNDSNPSN
ncbi:MAG: hypothetical protein AAGF26_15110 [Cyanobacteria bacterium P01_G01_bin.49]